MKKGYYIHFEGRSSIGVSKKIDTQLEEFRRHYEVEELEVKTIPRTLLQRIFGLLPAASITRDYQAVLDQVRDPDFFYIRRTVADKEYLQFFKTLKERYPDCKILVELFVYPYDKDNFGKWNAWPFYFKEAHYRKRLKLYVDRFVTTTEDKVIFGVPAITSTNGINVNAVPPAEGSYREGQLTMLGVAYMHSSHGYERVIRGMHQYYEKADSRDFKVYLKLAGEGPEKKTYQKLVQKYGLEEYVTFYPTTTGEALDRLYDQTDIALAAFGMYKVGYYTSIGVLKTRECLAKGIPLISGSPVDILPEDFKYALVFPNDSSPVDIGKVVSFYRSICGNEEEKKNMVRQLRAFAKEHADIAVVMKPVMDFLGE